MISVDKIMCNEVQYVVHAKVTQGVLANGRHPADFKNCCSQRSLRGSKEKDATRRYISSAKASKKLRLAADFSSVRADKEIRTSTRTADSMIACSV